MLEANCPRTGRAYRTRWTGIRLQEFVNTINCHRRQSFTPFFPSRLILILTIVQSSWFDQSHHVGSDGDGSGDDGWWESASDGPDSRLSTEIAIMWIGLGVRRAIYRPKCDRNS